MLLSGLKKTKFKSPILFFSNSYGSDKNNDLKLDDNSFSLFIINSDCKDKNDYLLLNELELFHCMFNCCVNCCSVISQLCPYLCSYCVKKNTKLS